MSTVTADARAPADDRAERNGGRRPISRFRPNTAAVHHPDQAPAQPGRRPAVPGRQLGLRHRRDPPNNRPRAVTDAEQTSLDGTAVSLATEAAGGRLFALNHRARRRLPRPAPDNGAGRSALDRRSRPTTNVGPVRRAQPDRHQGRAVRAGPHPEPVGPASAAARLALHSGPRAVSAELGADLRVTFTALASLHGGVRSGIRAGRGAEDRASSVRCRPVGRPVRSRPVVDQRGRRRR